MEDEEAAAKKLEKKIAAAAGKSGSVAGGTHADEVAESMEDGYGFGNEGPGMGAAAARQATGSAAVKPSDDEETFTDPCEAMRKQIMELQARAQ